MQMVRCASIELRRHSVCCFALHPGTVDTNLTRAFARARAKYKVCLGGKACVVHMWLMSFLKAEASPRVWFYVMTQCVLHSLLAKARCR